MAPLGQLRFRHVWPTARRLLDLRDDNANYGMIPTSRARTRRLAIVAMNPFAPIVKSVAAPLVPEVT